MIAGRWLVVATAVLVGGAAGLGAFTFSYAQGQSYLTNDPAACANCHVMGNHYSAWLKSSHHASATCNDCHTPRAPAGKYYTKARNGFLHSLYFTLGGYPDPIRITTASRRVTEGACRSCHAEIVAAIDGGASHVDAGPANSCIRCHATVGHWVR